jgi:hypothetical protein
MALAKLKCWLQPNRIRAAAQRHSGTAARLHSGVAEVTRGQDGSDGGSVEASGLRRPHTAPSGFRAQESQLWCRECLPVPVFGPAVASLSCSTRMRTFVGHAVIRVALGRQSAPPDVGRRTGAQCSCRSTVPTPDAQPLPPRDVSPGLCRSRVVAGQGTAGQVGATVGRVGHRTCRCIVSSSPAATDRQVPVVRRRIGWRHPCWGGCRNSCPRRLLRLASRWPPRCAVQGAMRCTSCQHDPWAEIFEARGTGCHQPLGDRAWLWR